MYHFKLCDFVGELYKQTYITIFLVLLNIILLLFFAIRNKNNNKNNILPPGPLGIPILGYLTFLGNEKHTKFEYLSKKYGSIFSARLGCQLTVVISDYKIIREAFKKYEFSGRPKTPLMNTLNGFGIINSEGKLWKDQRRFLHEKLRHFGMSYLGHKKELMEKRIMVEVNELVNSLNQLKGGECDPGKYFSVAVSNVICNLLMSTRFSIDDPQFIRFNWLIEEGMRLFGEVHMIEFVPVVQYLPGKVNARSKIARNRNEMFDFYREVIQNHRNTFDQNNLRDLLDTYLLEMKRAQEDGCEKELFEGKDCDEQIMQVLSDLFSAGMETIRTTLLWLLVFMLRHPDHLKRIQKELDDVIGRKRKPCIEDMPYLPITETTIMEVLRITSIVPLGTTHSPTSDIILHGYTIPAGSHVIPLINKVHKDPNLWHNPEEFNPNRFIDAEGRVRRPEYFMPFGVGRRKCLGDVLARMELFLFFSTLAHSFNIELPHGADLPSLRGNVGVTITPHAFSVCLKPRIFDTAVLDLNEFVLNRESENSEQLRNIGSY